MKFISRDYFFACSIFFSISCFAENVSPEGVAGWAKFKEGVLSASKDTVIGLANFPIPSNDLGGPIKSEKQLRQRFDKVFEPWVKECFKEAKPEPSDKKDEFVVNCNGYLFGFKNVDGVYKFSYIDNINE